MNDEPEINIGENIDEMLYRAKKSTRQVGAKIGVSPTTISRWTRNLSCPTALQAKALCDALGQPLEALYDYRLIERKPKVKF